LNYSEQGQHDFEWKEYAAREELIRQVSLPWMMYLTDASGHSLGFIYWILRLLFSTISPREWLSKNESAYGHARGLLPSNNRRPMPSPVSNLPSNKESLLVVFILLGL
jgi:hypothetical protein